MKLKYLSFVLFFSSVYLQNSSSLTREEINEINKERVKFNNIADRESGTIFAEIESQYHTSDEKDQDEQMLEEPIKIPERKKEQIEINSSTSQRLLLDVLVIILFLLSAISFMKITKNYHYKINMYEREFRNRSSRLSQQVENILEILNQQGKNKLKSQNFYSTYSKIEKFFFQAYDLEDFYIAQRIIKYQDTTVQEIEEKKNNISFLALIKEKLMFFKNLKNLISLKRILQLNYVSIPEIPRGSLRNISNDVENQKLADEHKNSAEILLQFGDESDQILEQFFMSSSYKGILKHIEFIFKKLLSADSQLRFSKIKYFGTNKIYLNSEIKVLIYLCTEKQLNNSSFYNENKAKEMNQEYISLQVENMIRQFMKVGLKIQRIVSGDDYNIINHRLILNPCIILKHDPQITPTYYRHIYKQMCKQLNIIINQNFLAEIHSFIKLIDQTNS